MQRAADIFAKVVLWAAFLLMPLLAHAGGLGIAPIGVLIGLAGLAIMLAYKIPLFTKGNFWIWPFIAFLVWVNITTFWSPYQSDGLTNAHKILLTGLALIPAYFVLVRTSEPDQHMYRHLFMAGGVFAVCAMTWDVLSGWGLSIMVDPPQSNEVLSKRQGDAMMNVGHGLYTYAQYGGLLLALFLVYLAKAWRWIAAIAFCSFLIAGSYFNGLSVGIIAVISLVMIFVVAMWQPKLALGFSFILAIGSILFAPLVGIVSKYVLSTQSASLPTSWEHRLHMWAYSWDKIKAAPLLGQGFDASRTYQESYMSNAGYEIVIVSLHPHNIGLQIWLEVGAIGAALLCAAIALLWRKAAAYAQHPVGAAALASTIIGITLIGVTTIGAWQFWWWGAIAFIIAILPLAGDNAAVHKNASTALNPAKL